MLEKRIGVLMYQTSTSKGQELVAQRMVRDLNRLGQPAFLITSTYHDGNEVVPRQSLEKGRGYTYIEDRVLQIPVIRVSSHINKWPPRRIGFGDFISVLERIVAEFRLNVLITHSTLWNGPEEVAKFIAWRRAMRQLGGYQDPIVFAHMSHFQEPSPHRYALPELTYRIAWNKLSLTKVFEMANLLLVVTPIEAKAKCALGARPEQCFLFPGGVDDPGLTRFAAADPAELRRRYNIRDEVHIVAYLGSIEERKNPLTVLKVAEALQERPDIHFVLAGRGGTPYAEKVKEFAGRLPNVSYLGEIDEETKVKLMKAARLNILLSRLEALGLTQMEFMYHGVPVVTSAAGGQSWVVRDGEEGVHVKGAEDVTGAAAAVIQLIEDKERWQKLATNARLKAQHYVCTDGERTYYIATPNADKYPGVLLP